MIEAEDMTTYIFCSSFCRSNDHWAWNTGAVLIIIPISDLRPVYWSPRILAHQLGDHGFDPR